MNGLNLFEKFLFLLNSLFAVALLFSYLLPYIPPHTFALLSVFSLAVPLFIIINIIFLLYWLFRLKKQMLLSLVVLLLGWNHLSSIYEISSSEEGLQEATNVKLLSYNVKQFNQFGWAEDEDIPGKIAGFVKEKDPDIIAIQEYFRKELNVARSYPHRYVKLKTPSAEFGLAIFSKYPIINSGSLDFPTASNNNAIYSDIVIGTDTIRVINVHLQSYSVKPSMDKIEKEESKRVFLGMGRTFVQQEEQINMILDLLKDSPYRSIVMGDFNNTAYSYIYRRMHSEGFYDAFKEVGNGFGRTFDFRFFPLRIDFIMPQDSIRVITFENFQEVPYSDHFPIQATIEL